MNKIKAFALASIMCLGIFSGCGKKDTVTSSVSEAPVLPAEGEVGDVISPDDKSEEYDLGEYRMSHDGIKLYYSDRVSSDLMLTLEKYFQSLQTHDFEAYKACIFPDYIDSIETFLQENYQYGFEDSFEKQCDNLKALAGGDFKVTRLKVEYPDEAPDEETGETAEFDKEQSVTDFLAHLDSLLGGDFSKKVREDADDFEYVTFYVMAENSAGEEMTLISEYDILLAVKDGNYYTFG